MSLAILVNHIYDRIESAPLNPVWISIVPREAALARAAALEADPANKTKPLYGVPFAVKDNMDVAGMPTTAGCPDYAYVPQQTAFVVQRLLDAGAILIGKTNLDQFATGLVGVRSPYGACSSIYDERYLSGGSSSGSAVAVASGLVTFALGTDTAGSGRVPAAFNNLIGLKPSRGLLSTEGVVPACRSLDCVSIFARNLDDARAAFDVACAFDATDPFARKMPAAPPALAPQSLRVGVPARADLEFFGDEEAESLYYAALEKLPGERVEIDFKPFREAAMLLYSGPWVAERLAAIREFASNHAEAIHPIVRGIITGASKYSAVDTFTALYKLAALRRETEHQWELMDVLALPTTGTIYTKEAVEKDPVQLNTNLGYYTNFVNLLDLSALAIPAGFRANGLPFGISLIAPAFADHALLNLAAGKSEGTPRGHVEIAVVGAHLSGQPLNHQLTSRGAWLVKTTRTAPEYRFYALPNTTPPKPGLVREPGFEGPGIEVEVWCMTDAAFGTFVAEVPPPLTIGTVRLADDKSVKCFLTEPYAVTGARDITSLGGWRAFVAAPRV